MLKSIVSEAIRYVICFDVVGQRQGGTYHSNKRSLKFMADNCQGQYKNKFMVWWMVYLLAVSPTVSEIELRFLMADHSKNFCDACFGMCKRSIRQQTVLTPDTLMRHFAALAKCN